MLNPDESRTQEVMNKAYDRWQNTGWSQDEFWAQLSLRERIAVFVGKLNQQVENGGFSQWNYNSYSDCSDELIKFLRAIGPTGRQVADMVIEALSRIATCEPGHYDTVMVWDEELEEDVEDEEWVEDEMEDLDDLDTLFYTLNDRMLDELEAVISLPEAEFEAWAKAERFN